MFAREAYPPSIDTKDRDAEKASGDLHRWRTPVSFIRDTTHLVSFVAFDPWEVFDRTNTMRSVTHKSALISFYWSHFFPVTGTAPPTLQTPNLVLLLNSAAASVVRAELNAQAMVFPSLSFSFNLRPGILCFFLF